MRWQETTTHLRGRKTTKNSAEVIASQERLDLRLGYALVIMLYGLSLENIKCDELWLIEIHHHDC